MTLLKDKVIQLEEKYFYYQLFCHYYRGDLLYLTSIQWKKLLQTMREYPFLMKIDEVNQALQMIKTADENEIAMYQYDYNRLFVGPNQLLASPFESSYRNYEKNVLQRETLMVRNFYHHVGLQVADEGQIPDDHMQFELELILYLLSNENDQENLYEVFLTKHLFHWGFDHCQRILENSQNPITYAMGVLLREFLQQERMSMEGGNIDAN
ncbi:molecular chaperone TorD family protein [Niallia sp. XMNu-256]|uniref:TorD/DmsD family molecular chaperone n=1 Tax=Niallia sp. XMNu-256 TaxID=3082444 RepID=UPI0030D0A81E